MKTILLTENEFNKVRHILDEDAYMDAMDAELDEIIAKNKKKEVSGVISYNDFTKLTEDDIPEDNAEYRRYCDKLCIDMNGNLVYIWKNPKTRWSDHVWYRLAYKTKRMKSVKSTGEGALKFEHFQKMIKDLHEEYETSSTDKVNVGDIFVYQYGYEANIVHFYKVTKIIGSSMVEIVEMSKNVENEEGYYNPSVGASEVTCGKKVIGEPMRKAIYLYKGEPHIKISSYGSCHLWNGKPCSEYNYH